jgi:hypothetical protein
MQPMTFNHDTRLIRNPDMMCNSIDGEVVMLDPEAGKYYNLNQVGSLVWEQLEQPMRCDDLVKAICLKFEVDFEQSWADLTGFLQQLAAAKMISAVPD